MFFLFILIMLLSLSMIFYSHPVAIMVIILIQTFNICVMMWMLTKTSWFSFILFLIFLGGLMVLFVYITSLASNEVFKINLFNNTQMLFMISVLFLIFSMKSFFNTEPSDLLTNMFSKIDIIFSSNMTLPTTLIMTYLLLVLIITVKISSKMEGPIRNFI